MHVTYAILANVKEVEIMQKAELLAPAGNLEKLKAAILYGADAVYLGGMQYGLRASAGNFTLEEMEEGINFAHQHGARVYVTVNIIAHNEDLAQLPDYLKQLDQLQVDAIIVADPGVLMIVQETIPDMEVHLSTQASNTSWRSAQFWAKQGVKRIILARELTLDEISEIVIKVPDMIFESFAHGSMCMSYSGRCLLSNYLTGRDSNRGQCAQPCRWEYDVIEKSRPDQSFKITEDDRGTYIFNSKDMCTIEILPQILATGVKSIKIEGRMKSLHYVATVTRAYRQALDAYYDDPAHFQFDLSWLAELQKPSHRPYFTGFYQIGPGEVPNEADVSQYYSSSGYIRPYQFLGVVLEYDLENKRALVEQRNPLVKGDLVEVMDPNGCNIMFRIQRMVDVTTGDEIERAPHARQNVWLDLPEAVSEWSLIRREIK